MRIFRVTDIRRIYFSFSRSNMFCMRGVARKGLQLSMYITVRSSFSVRRGSFVRILSYNLHLCSFCLRVTYSSQAFCFFISGWGGMGVANSPEDVLYYGTPVSPYVDFVVIGNCDV